MNAASPSIVAGFTLLPDEEVVRCLQGDTVVLTSHRVRSYSKSLDEYTVANIMLDELDICGMIRRRNPVLLIVAFVALLVGVWLYCHTGRLGTSSEIAAIIAITFILSYFLSRAELVELRSGAAVIQVRSRAASFRLNRDDLPDFIKATEAAKSARHLLEKETSGVPCGH